MNGENTTPLQAAGEPRERSGVPRRVERLPRRVRNRHRRPGQRHHQVGRQLVPRRRCSNTCAATRWTRANYFDSTRSDDGSIIYEAGSSPTVPKSPLKLNQFGGSVGGPIVKRPRVLLRQLRRLSAGRRQEPHRGRAERRRVGARRPGDRRLCGPGSWRRAPSSSAGCVDQSRLRHRRSCRATQDVNENAFSGRAGPQDQRQLVVLRARVPRPGRELRSRRTSAAGVST